jgi:hypothetical protein
LRTVRSVFSEEKKLSIAATIRVVEKRIRLAPPPDRHQQRIGDELRRYRGTHRPADHPPGEPRPGQRWLRKLIVLANEDAGGMPLAEWVRARHPGSAFIAMLTSFEFLRAPMTRSAFTFRL